jgi:polysaccharide export outer membrane protein
MKQRVTILLALILLAMPPLTGHTQSRRPSSQSYELQKGDIISIEVMEHEEFSKRVQILPDGTIEYPLLGNILVTGLTASELAKLIQDNITPFVPDPVVTVYVVSIYGEHINILGNVNDPGRYQIFQSVDILQALSMAGGAEDPDQLEYITIIRENGEVLKINMKKLMTAKTYNKVKHRIQLHVGDTMIAVPEKHTNWSFIGASLSFLGLVVQIINYSTR